MLDHKQGELQEVNIGLQSVKELRKCFSQDGYTIHNRVLRWYKATPDQISTFDNNSYASLSRDNMILQQDYHSLHGVALLFCVKNHEDYFFNTPKGKSAFAHLEIGDRTYEGMLEIGICPKKKVVYHMMFNDKVKHKPEQLFEITNPIIEDLDEDNQASLDWCNKDGYEISKENANYVIRLGMPTSNSPLHEKHRSTKKLYIYPNKLSIESIKKIVSIRDTGS